MIEAAARQIWGVQALLLAVSDALAARFGAVAVRGELSGVSRAGSGHLYFALKDAGGAGAMLRCAMFRRAASAIDFAPADGLQVELRGRLALYEPRGELQFVVESMQRLGAGTLYEEFLRLRARLQDEGLFDDDRKRVPVQRPRGVGIVTSPMAAALRDVLTSFARRAPHVRLVLYPAPVQGAEAPAALVQALHTAGQRYEVDTLLLVRGGGSLEDLWAFNDERVVRAVAACPLPVICGVGHETDVSLCDLAADLRAPTPTAAAELATLARDAQWAQLALQATVMRRVVGRRLETQAQRLDTLMLRLGRPARVLAPQQHALQRLAQRLQAAVAGRRERARQGLPLIADRLQRAVVAQRQAQVRRLDLLAGRLQSLDPRTVLARGYAWVEDADGRPVLQAAALAAGQPVQGVWADGGAALRVEAVVADAAAAALPASGPAPDA